MPEEIRQHCFEPFFTTKGERGTGLGLSMVYGIIQRHEGTVEIESQPGAGTAFVIRLPVKTWQHFDPAQSQPAASATSWHVLVVDDEPMILDFLSSYLTGDGHTVECAATGVEALEKFGQADFDLVITDSAMPGMGGEKLALFLKQRQPQVPVIMLTGFGLEKEATGQRPPGVDCLLSKPITISELRQAMLEVTGKK
jgi:CheY-like chemotaxis protein